MSKNILTAIRVGGGNTSPESNLSLKLAIDKAKSVNMPKENIERLIEKFEQRKGNLVGFTIEGFAKGGIPIIVEAETDNKNRTMSELKLIFRDHEATVGDSNSVAFMFDKLGEIILSQSIDEDTQLELIDFGAVDFDDKTIFTNPADLNKVEQKVKEKGLEIDESGLVMRVKSPILVESEEELSSIMELIEVLEEHDDVINVFAGFDYHE